jgi:hypothetical protein
MRIADTEEEKVTNAGLRDVTFSSVQGFSLACLAMGAKFANGMQCH